MAIQTTQWTPDTCSNPPCVIEYTWDDAVPVAARTHTASRIIRQCAHHDGMDIATHWSALTDENPRKNRLLDWVATNTSFTRDQISWSFDSNRVLTITVIGLTANQQTTAQNWANNNLGVGKVIVVRG